MRPGCLQQLIAAVDGAGSDGHVVPASDGVGCVGPYRLQATLRVRAVAHHIAQAEDGIRPGLGLLQGKQCFPIGVQVAKDDNPGHYRFFCYTRKYESV